MPNLFTEVRLALGIIPRGKGNMTFKTTMANQGALFKPTRFPKGRGWVVDPRLSDRTFV